LQEPANALINSVELRALLEKLTDLKTVRKFPTFYGTRRFITVFTRAHHLSHF
jgi:hypothetical protein